MVEDLRSLIVEEAQRAVKVSRQQAKRLRPARGESTFVYSLCLAYTGPKADKSGKNAKIEEKWWVLSEMGVWWRKGGRSGAGDFYRQTS